MALEWSWRGISIDIDMTLARRHGIDTVSAMCWYGCGGGVARYVNGLVLSSYWNHIVLV